MQLRKGRFFRMFVDQFISQLDDFKKHHHSGLLFPNSLKHTNVALSIGCESRCTST